MACTSRPRKKIQKTQHPKKTAVNQIEEMRSENADSEIQNSINNHKVKFAY